jgi:hypothetical protein
MRLRAPRGDSKPAQGPAPPNAAPNPYALNPRRSGMAKPTSTFVDALTGHLQAGRRTRGYIVLFILVSCFGFVAASIIHLFVDRFDDMRQRAVDRPALIERRHVDTADLDLYTLHTFYSSYYNRPVRIRLVDDGGVTRLIVSSRNGDILLKRRLVPSDLDHQRILIKYSDRTGDFADVIDLYYKEGQAMLVVRSSDFDM